MISSRTHAPFLVGGAWRWIAWNHSESNLHAAVHAKAKELGADAWDTSQASHAINGTVVFGHPTALY